MRTKFSPFLVQFFIVFSSSTFTTKCPSDLVCTPMMSCNDIGKKFRCAPGSVCCSSVKSSSKADLLAYFETLGIQPESVTHPTPSTQETESTTILTTTTSKSVMTTKKTTSSTNKKGYSSTLKKPAASAKPGNRTQTAKPAPSKVKPPSPKKEPIVKAEPSGTQPQKPQEQPYGYYPPYIPQLDNYIHTLQNYFGSAYNQYHSAPYNQYQSVPQVPYGQYAPTAAIPYTQYPLVDWTKNIPTYRNEAENRPTTTASPPVVKPQPGENQEPPPEPDPIVLDPFLTSLLYGTTQELHLKQDDIENLPHHLPNIINKFMMFPRSHVENETHARSKRWTRFTDPWLTSSGLNWKLKQKNTAWETDDATPRTSNDFAEYSYIQKDENPEHASGQEKYDSLFNNHNEFLHSITPRGGNKKLIQDWLNLGLYQPTSSHTPHWSLGRPEYLNGRVEPTVNGRTSEVYPMFTTNDIYRQILQRLSMPSPWLYFNQPPMPFVQYPIQARGSSFYPLTIFPAHRQEYRVPISTPNENKVVNSEKSVTIQGSRPIVINMIQYQGIDLKVLEMMCQARTLAC